MLWTSLSFLLVGIVHWWRGFDRYLSVLLVIVGIFGILFPFILVFPFFIIFWRVLAGRHVDTDCRLYIGQHRRMANYQDVLSADSNTMAHWIVVTDPGNSNYEVMHAVDDQGPVSSGGGKKLYSITGKGKIDSKYHLHHVGWVTKRSRATHMKLVTDNEPMQSGYTCQEYAFDIAFQLSSSRTYTYIKSFFLPRARNFVGLCLLILSLAINIATEVWHTQVIIIVPVNTDLFNPITVLNMFIVLESYRLGFTNNLSTRIERKTSYQGLKDRLNVYFHYIKSEDRLKLLGFAVYLAIFHMYVGNIMFTLSLALLCILIAKK